MRRSRPRNVWPMSVGLIAVLAMASPALAGPRENRGGKARRAESSAHQRDRDRGNDNRVSVTFDLGGRRDVRHGRHRPRVVHRRTVVTRHERTGGHYESRWVPAVTEMRYDRCGRPYTVVIRAGYYERVWAPDRHVTTQVYRPARHWRRPMPYRHRPHVRRGGVRIRGHFEF